MHPTNSADHVSHDLTLIAGHAAGDLPDTDRVHVDALLSRCTPCADLRRDLVAIAAATRALPAPAVPARDFRLAPEQAARLQRGSWLRVALRPFAASGSAVRPMAAGFTSLGLAGLLVATVIPSLLGSPGAGPDQREGGFQAAQASPEAAAPGATQGSVAPQAAKPSSDRGVHVESGDPDGHGSSEGNSGGVATDAPAVAVAGAATDALVERLSHDSVLVAPALNPLIAGSLGLLLVGLLMFGLRFASRRLR